jgi:hypothetical protein
MRTNLPNLPNSCRLEFNKDEVYLHFTLSFPKEYGNKLSQYHLNLYCIQKNNRYWVKLRTRIWEVSNDSICRNYFLMKNQAMKLARRAKIHALQQEVIQLEMF